jgi:hypothetical protein
MKQRISKLRKEGLAKCDKETRFAVAMSEPNVCES